MLDAFLKQLQLETSYQMLKHITILLKKLTKRRKKMYAQSPCTLINEFAHRLFCETKIPRSVIPQYEFFEK